MIRIVFTCISFFFLSFFGTAAAFAQTDSEDLAAIAKAIYEGATSGQYAFAAAMGVVLLVALLRRYGGARWPILSHKLVAPVLVLLASFGGAVASALGAGAAVSMGTLWAALKIAALGAGGYSILKPYIGALGDKAPAWAQPLIAILAAIFSAKQGAADAKAAKAGQDAVAADPGAGVPIKFTDVE